MFTSFASATGRTNMALWCVRLGTCSSIARHGAYSTIPGSMIIAIPNNNNNNSNNSHSSIYQQLQCRDYQTLAQRRRLQLLREQRQRQQLRHGGNDDLDVATKTTRYADASDHMVGSRSTNGPSLETALRLPMAFRDMDNASLVVLSTLGHYEARVEVLKRHIMTRDEVSYAQACDVFAQISLENRKGMFLASVPYQVGIAVALTAGFASIPLCFHLPTVEWFNHYFVTADIPEPKDLETFLEVGSWAWNWMEPPLGQISFFLLCLQFTRAQLSNLGIRPYTTSMKRRRGDRLARLFPKYCPKILKDFSEADDIYHDR